MSATFSRTLRSLEADRAGRPWLRTAVLAAMLSAWTAWFLLGTVALHEVTDSARIEVVRAVHPIASAVAGRVVRSELAIGRRVAEGEVLIELDSEAERLALEEGRARVRELEIRLVAIEKELETGEAASRGQGAARAIAAEEAQAQAAEAETRARAAEVEVERLARLGKIEAAGAVSEVDRSRARAEADASRARARALTLGIERLDRDRRAAELEYRREVAETARIQAELEGQLGVVRAANRRLEHDIERRVIRASVAGRIGEAAELRAGAVVQSAERLGAIVPDSAVRAVAQFPVAALGRLKPGQPGRLRLDAFPWTRYGKIAATVAHVASEPKDGRVRVELALVEDAGSTIPIEHGLAGSAEVEVERASPFVTALRAAGALFAGRRAPGP